MNTTVFLLDNFDSFTYNLVDELRGLGYELVIYRNSVSADKIFAEMQQKALSNQVMLMLSPGPGTPTDAGCMGELIQLTAGTFPILGICLGHQAIVQHFGGKVIRASNVMHGKSSLVNHHHDDIFKQLPNPLPVARYHSLMASDMPETLTVIAEIANIPMAVCHTQQRMLGFQFHPESILTSHGSQLLKQSIDYLTEHPLL